MARRRRPVVDALGFVPPALALGLARALPYRARLGFAGWLGRTIVGLSPKLRARVDANLAYVMPDLDADARARIRRGVGDTFGRTFVEILTNRAFHARRSWIGPTGAGVAVVEAAARDGRPAVLVTGHYGQWEAARAWMKSVGINCAGVYRPTDNPHLNRIYLENLEFGGTPIFPKGAQGVRGIVRHVAKGGIVAILTDQYERRARPFDFVGRPAPTSTVPAEIALKYGAPLIPVFCTRAPDGDHVRVEMEAPIPPSTAAEMTQAINDRLAARIRATPEQYYWLHRRWEKRLPGLAG
jgi:KDO2-lipid IV(A) lauroyltransferase